MTRPLQNFFNELSLQKELTSSYEIEQFHTIDNVSLPDLF